MLVLVETRLIPVTMDKEHVRPAGIIQKLTLKPRKATAQIAAVALDRTT